MIQRGRTVPRLFVIAHVPSCEPSTNQRRADALVDLVGGDLPLHRSDPSLLQPLLAAIEPAGVPVVLLHCYPYHRQAGWLAPFQKLLFSTDAYRLPEVYLVGAAQFRHGFGRLLDDRVTEGATALDDAHRGASMVGADNATARLPAADRRAVGGEP